jgi:hypothetical protein
MSGNAYLYLCGTLTEAESCYENTFEIAPSSDVSGLVLECVQRYMQLITDGDAAELGRFLLIDGGITEKYTEMAQRIIEYYTQYDTRRASASVQSVDYRTADSLYTVSVSDGRGDEFTVYVVYGDGLVGIDVRMFEND